MVRLIDANELIRAIKFSLHYPGAVVEMINKQPYILIEKVNTLEDIKKRGVFVARKEK